MSKLSDAELKRLFQGLHPNYQFYWKVEYAMLIGVTTAAVQQLMTKKAINYVVIDGIEYVVGPNALRPIHEPEIQIIDFAEQLKMANTGLENNSLGNFVSGPKYQNHRHG